MSKSKIDEMAEDTAPKNFSEFYLGMVLMALHEEMSQDDEDFDPFIYDTLMEKIPHALEYWRKKYKDEYEIAVGKTDSARKSVGNGE